MKLSGRGEEREGKGNSLCFADADGGGTGHLLLQRAAVVAASLEETIRRVSDLFVPCPFISCYLHDPVILEQRKLLRFIRLFQGLPSRTAQAPHSLILSPPCPCSCVGWVEGFSLHITIPFPPQVDFNMTDFTRNTTLRSSSSVNQSYFVLGKETAKFQKDALYCCTQFSDADPVTALVPFS